MSSRAGNHLALVATFLRQGGGPRAVLVACCTAVVSALLLVVVTVLLWSSAGDPHEQLANVVADPGVRGGFLFGVLLVCLAPLALLRQVLRLGSAAREQRLAGLRVAGATPSDVRRLAAVEVAGPAFVGALLGWVLFLGLRAVLAGSTGSARVVDVQSAAGQLRMVPVSVSPSWWQVLLVALLVAAAGAVAGATTARGVTVSPHGVSRRAPRSAPRPWGVLLVLLAVPALWLSAQLSSTAGGLAAGIGSVALLVLGLLGLAPWVAYRIGVTVASRAVRPHLVVAARRLATDPRPAARASAAIGAIGAAAGFAGFLTSDLPETSGGSGFSDVEAMYTVPLAIVGAVLLLALLLVVFSLAVHGVESITDRRRAVASLAALGTTQDELALIQRWEVGLVAIPVTVLGVVLGSLPALLTITSIGVYSWIPLVVDVVTVAAAWAAVRASTRLTRPWLARASSPLHLRSE